MKALVIAEHDNQTLRGTTHHTLTAATTLCKHVDVLVAGQQCIAVANRSAKLSGVNEVLYLDAEVYAHHLAENLARVISELSFEYDYLLAPATTFGKNLLPRIAALLDVAVIADVVTIISADTFVRPIYAGNALATIQSLDKIKLLTVRTTAFPATSESTAGNAPIRHVEKIIPNSLSQFETQEIHTLTRPELTTARVIVAGGRGLKNAENFHLLEALADRLGAAIGASRAAVDAGFCPNDYQVGQTGKVVAPELYIAIGISGAIQHLAGMKDSKVIVAINSDPDAPIFQIADYGLVGDLFKILPELNQALDKINSA